MARVLRSGPALPCVAGRTACRLRNRAARPASSASLSRSALRLLCMTCTVAVTAQAVPSPPSAADLHARGQVETCAFVGCGGAVRRHVGVLRPVACPASLCGPTAALGRRVDRGGTDGALALRAQGRRAVERAALELAAAEQVELKYKLEADVLRLQAERDEVLEKEEWERILRLVEKDVEKEGDEEPGPWELTPDLLEEVEDVFQDSAKSAADYLRIALGDNTTGMDIIGEMRMLDDDLVQDAFDAAIEEQKGKEPKGVLGLLRKGLSGSSRCISKTP